MQTLSLSHSRLAIALSLALACAPVCARPVPAGFEDLAAGQTERLDVRLMGRSAGVWPVFVTPEGVRLLEPEPVLAALELSEEAKAVLGPALSETLPRNGHLACQNTAPEAGCGYLAPPEDPATVGVIHDESEGVLNLFPARQWLPAAGPERERYHRPNERAQNAFIHQQMLNISGGSGYMSLSALGNGTVGVLRNAYVGVDWNYNRQQNRGYGAMISRSTISTCARTSRAAIIYRSAALIAATCPARRAATSPSACSRSIVSKARASAPPRRIWTRPWSGRAAR